MIGEDSGISVLLALLALLVLMHRPLASPKTSVVLASLLLSLTAYVWTALDAEGLRIRDVRGLEVKERGRRSRMGGLTE